MQKKKRALCWIRRDLRLNDHAALAAAAAFGDELVVCFNFDPKILNKLDRQDRRLTFIHKSLEEIDQKLRENGSQLLVRIGDPTEEIPKVAKALSIDAVFTNADYEPYAISRDAKVHKGLQSQGIAFHSFKDQVIFEKREILNGSGESFKVYTAYKNAWLKAMRPEHYEEKKVRWKALLAASEISSYNHEWSMKQIGFTPSPLWLEPGRTAALKRLRAFLPKIHDYKKLRDIPSVDGTSGLSVHFRFGTLSVREAVRAVNNLDGEGPAAWLNELTWRDFYHMILANNPHVVGHSFKKELEGIVWPGKKEHFEAWCAGKTGFPIIDAAMRHFNTTGWMHNRLRMVVASFLTKDLLVDWRLGEDYFAKHLLDFDLAANNGGWQWSASTGCDAQPYFRIFNPYSQSERFDPDGAFIRSEVPELKLQGKKTIHCPDGILGYPLPIVDHSIQRAKALALFKK